MNREEFRRQIHHVADWVCDYLDDIEKLPVRAQSKPGEVIRQLPESAPEDPELFESIMQDFKDSILPGMTHWQHPGFFGYFPANNSAPSILAEILVAAMGAQCMSWQTSPAATELEERVLEWLAGLLCLPEGFTGVLESGASLATYSSLLTARERASEGQVNRQGLKSVRDQYTMYCSVEAHASVEKAVRMSGIGEVFLRKIPVDERCCMDVAKLEQAVKKDVQEGYKPLWLTAVLGTTGTTAVDPVPAIAEITRQYGIWLHVDAAYAGPCMMLSEYSYLREGLSSADSLVLNPHKWMFTNFDCSAYYVKDPDLLKQTYSILPEYLKTKEDQQVNNYRDWGPSLGRRFRALKLWFVLRNFGAEGIRKKIRFHISCAKNLAAKIESHSDFELLAPVNFNLVCFRLRPQKGEDPLALNSGLLEALNSSGKVYLTHTKIHGIYALRVVLGQTELQEYHVDQLWDLLVQTGSGIRSGKM